MLKINPQQLSDNDAFLLSNLLSAMEGQSESHKYASLAAFPQFKAIMVFHSEELYEQVDKAVRPYQRQLLAAHQVYFDALLELEKASKILVDLMTDEVKFEYDSGQRPTAWVKVDLYNNKEYMVARKSVQTARLRVSKIWNKAVPLDLVPFEELDKLNAGGTKGLQRTTLPAWEFREGQILCQRETS